MLAFVVSLIMQGLPLPFSELVVPPEKEWTQEMVKELAIEQAEKYGLHKKRFLAVLECENNFQAKGQSVHYYKGKREESYGAVQIHLPSHPGITKEMAESPEFAISWMAQKWSVGEASIWACYNILFPPF